MNDNIVNMTNARAQRLISKADEAGAFASDKDIDLDEAMAGPLVAAAPGHYLILADYHPAKRVPVLAWRVGKRIALPVSYLGTWDGESVIEYPDGIVREHHVGGDGREHNNLAEYLAFEEAETTPPVKAAAGTLDAPSDDDIPF